KSKKSKRQSSSSASPPPVSRSNPRVQDSDSGNSSPSPPPKKKQQPRSWSPSQSPKANDEYDARQYQKSQVGFSHQESFCDCTPDLHQQNSYIVTSLFYSSLVMGAVVMSKQYYVAQ
ncbi:unnamed protein product, partial [Candidula unifasciata]